MRSRGEHLGAPLHPESHRFFARPRPEMVAVWGVFPRVCDMLHRPQTLADRGATRFPRGSRPRDAVSGRCLCSCPLVLSPLHTPTPAPPAWSLPNHGTTTRGSSCPGLAPLELLEIGIQREERLSPVAHMGCYCEPLAPSSREAERLVSEQITGAVACRSGPKAP